MKIAVLSDTHCGIRNSSDIFIEYQRRFYEEIFFPYLIENGITRILHLGDYYEHRKFINFKALHANRKHFLDNLRKYNIHMDIIPGNHDVFYKNTNNLCSVKELMGYYTDCVSIHMEPKIIQYDKCSVQLIPWINNENYAKSMQAIAQSTAHICAGHFEIAGCEMQRGIKSPHGMDRGPFDKFEMTLSGHYHTKSTTGGLEYLGSQMEFFWSDCGDPKYFHIFDSDSYELTPVRNPLTIYHKIMYNDSQTDYNEYDVSQCEHKFVKVIVSEKKDLYMFDRFIDRLHNVDIHELKIAETFDEYIGDNVEDSSVDVENTETLLDSYVEAVATDLDTDKLKSAVRDLYKEAQTLEIL